MTTYSLANDQLAMTLTATGGLGALRAVGTGTDFVQTPADLWRLVLDDGESRARSVTPDGQPVTVTVTSQALTLTIPHLILFVAGQERRLQIAVTLAGTLSEGELRWQVTVDNQEPGVRVMEVWGPMIGGLRPAEEWALYFPQDAGLRLKNPVATLGTRDTIERFGARNTVLRELYPGKASMQWMGLYSADEGLYFSVEDEGLRTLCLHVERVLGETTAEDTLQLAAIHYPGLRLGSWASPSIVVAVQAGDWHAGARRYRAWTDRWLTPPTPPAWVQRLPGLQDTILREQFGAQNYRYTDLPALHAAAADCGLELIKITGWHTAGHDNGYPDWVADPAQGGPAALKEQIARVRAAGGRVMVYLQTVQMTINSDWYREHGEAASVRDPYGNALADTFTWPGGSTYLPLSAQHRLIVACPANAAWQARIREAVEYVLDLEPDVVYLDRMAGYPGYLCFSDDHPHAAPNESVAPRLGVALECRALANARDTQIAVASEYINDAGLQAFDFTIPFGHGMHYGGTNFGELFRYTFPEYIITTQYLNGPEYDRVAFAVVMGYRLFFAIRWQHAPISETPAPFREFVQKTIALLATHADPFLTGRFVDTDALLCDNPALFAKCYRSAARAGVAVWNPTDDAQPLTIALADGALHWVGLEGPVEGFLPPYAFALGVRESEE
jgi:hypothetical protein